MTGRRRVVVLPDKFRGTYTAREVADAVVSAFGRRDPGLRVVSSPVSDGGEGALRLVVDRLGAQVRRSTVTGPYGDPVEAEWAVLPDGRAFVECARICGWPRVRGPLRPLESTTRGVGELLGEIEARGHGGVIVAIGGTVTVDGGRGAVEALRWRRPRLDVAVAADVSVRFGDCVRHFAPQKGASEADMAELGRRMAELRGVYAASLGGDVDRTPFGGAGGGLAAALGALGARVFSGCEVMLGLLGLSAVLARADIVVTGEGRFDETSWLGKATGSILSAARPGAGRGLLVGSIDAGAAVRLGPGTLVCGLTGQRLTGAELVRGPPLSLREGAEVLVARLLDGGRRG